MATASPSAFSNSRRPLIGLTAGRADLLDWDDRTPLASDRLLRHYGSAVGRAGGLPFIIPLVKEPMRAADEDFSGLCGPRPLFVNARAYLEVLDGLLLTGGGAVAPGHAQTPHPALKELDRVRDNWETAL